MADTKPAPTARPNRRQGILAALLVLAVALGLRLIGIGHGAPDLVYHPDVAKQTFVARRVFLGELSLAAAYPSNVGMALYPYGTAVITGRLLRAIAPLMGNPDLASVHRWYWAFWMRFLSTALFVAPALVVLATLRRRLGTPAALAISLLLVAEPVCSQISHYGMNDAPLLGMLMLAWVFALQMPDEPRAFPVHSLLCGLSLGLGFGIKYQALLGLAFPACTWAFFLPSRRLRWCLLSVAAVVVGAVAGALLVTPLLLQSPSFFFGRFGEFMEWQSNVTGLDMSTADRIHQNLPATIRMSTPAGHLVLCVGVAIACVRTLRGRLSVQWRAALAGPLLLCGALLAAVVGARDIARANDLAPVYLFAILASGIALSAGHPDGTPLPRRSLRAAAAVAVLLLCVFGANALLDSLALARPDTRRRAQQWCARNIPAGSVVLREDYTLPVQVTGVRDSLQRLLTTPRARNSLASGSYHFVITSSLAHSRFFDRSSPYRDSDAQEVYRGVARTHEQVARFTDRALPFAHPIVTIYRRPETPPSDTP